MNDTVYLQTDYFPVRRKNFASFVILRFDLQFLYTSHSVFTALLCGIWKTRNISLGIVYREMRQNRWLIFVKIVSYTVSFFTFKM